ncbi:prepilin-type N-terminal cleavage/methylation domain-containing protein [Virgibacillus sp. C22-A2]|uniref:Prepilin-type N-terminal cleavage/methylation domain-containing protein n=1 Tax=Virgibacillus tibetensis TaxID=3042313 RepID=A0ABU6KBQ0_9BACI|nr:prepilin-type N-terminal cleavage/methylation domain-containing protein [Virgibacillus sp. C22-A2]
MLKRMKMILKKEKGFTLVELLAVIAILGIILAIAIPSIGKVISNSEGKAHEANMDLFENAARLAYVSGNQEDTYTLNELEEKGFLDSIPDGFAGTEIVYVENNGGSFVYEDRRTPGN